MLVRFNFLSQMLMKQTNVTMILPSWEVFDATSSKEESYLPGTKFQVLYLFHGGMGDDLDYIQNTNIVRYANEHKLAVVMPCGYNSNYANKEPDGFYANRYWDYIFEELPKVCTSMFPISEKREDTFVAGLSMGSVAASKWAVYGGEKCKAALIMSGGALDDKKVNYVAMKSVGGTTDFSVDLTALKAEGFELIDRNSDIYLTAKKNAAQGQPLPDLYCTCGGNDFIRFFAAEYANEMKSYGYPVIYEEVPGFMHEWDFWDLSLKKALNEWFPLKNDVLLKDN